MQPDAKRELIILFVAGIGIFFLLIGYIVNILFIYQKRRNSYLKETEDLKESFAQQILKTRLEIQEQTFQQIGKELHDNVGQLLSSSRMLLGLTERYLEKPPDMLLTANATLGEAINELRSLSKSLDKEWLEQFSFADNLQTEIVRINSGNKVRAICERLDPIQLKPDEQIILFRIVQEAIQNAIKHANPSLIRVSAVQQENIFKIFVTDDGDGFEPTTNGNGMGLNNMKHRTSLLRGTISWQKLHDRGTTVIISLPQPLNHLV